MFSIRTQQVIALAAALVGSVLIGGYTAPALAQKASYHTARVTDQKATKSLQHAMSRDRLLNRSNVSAKVVHGRAIIKGRFNSNTAFNQALMLAQATPGVTRIDTTRVTVARSLDPQGDLMEATRIKKRLSRAHLNRVDVEVKNGIVLLSGRVDTIKQKAMAKRVAWGAASGRIQAVDPDAIAIMAIHRPRRG